MFFQHVFRSDISKHLLIFRQYCMCWRSVEKRERWLFPLCFPRGLWHFQSCLCIQYFNMLEHIISCMWSCTAELLVLCIRAGCVESERERERERRYVCKMDAIHMDWLRAQCGRESDPVAVMPEELHHTCLTKGTRPSLCLHGVYRQWGAWFSRGFYQQWGAVLSALQHSGWGERGEESLHGTPSWAPNQAPPCGAQANRQLAAEVKDWQLQERAAGREGLLGNLDPSSPNALNNWKRWKYRLKNLYVKKEKKVCCWFPTLKHECYGSGGCGQGCIRRLQ